VTAAITPPRSVARRTVAVHGPDLRPVLDAADRLAPGSAGRRQAASALGWSGRVDLVLHPGAPGLPPGADIPGAMAAVTVQRVWGGTAVEIAGALDGETTPFVRDAVDIGLGTGGRCLFLHLAAVVSCDDAGVELIGDLQRELPACGVGLVAVAVRPALRKVLWATAAGGRVIEQDQLPAPLPTAWVEDVSAPEPLVHW
jgi:anti-anti-sigma regulatory factor